MESFKWPNFFPVLEALVAKVLRKKILMLFMHMDASFHGVDLQHQRRKRLTIYL